MINSIKFSKRGFTLLETLVAVLLLSTALAGPLTIASKGIQSTTIARDQNTAFFLAQDAVEYIRWARDTNRLAGGNWLSGTGGTGTVVDLSQCVGNGSTYCYVDSLQNTVTSCILGSDGNCNTALNYDSTNNYVSNTSGSTSIFTRTISITNPVGSNNDDATILVRVSWSDQVGTGAGGVGSGAIKRSVTVREDLFNWQ